MNIARKLAVGFGLLVALTLSSAGVSYLGSRQATIKINTTGKVRVPIAPDASSAQANVRGYLALGNQDLGCQYHLCGFFETGSGSAVVDICTLYPVHCNIHRQRAVYRRTGDFHDAANYVVQETREGLD